MLVLHYRIECLYLKVLIKIAHVASFLQFTRLMNKLDSYKKRPQAHHLSVSFFHDAHMKWDDNNLSTQTNKDNPAGSYSPGESWLKKLLCVFEAWKEVNNIVCFNTTSGYIAAYQK